MNSVSGIECRPGAYVLAAASLLGQLTAVGWAEDDDHLDFFEERIRPVLVEYCYKCHSDQLQESAGSLQLHNRQSIRRGGATGPAVVPGDPDESLLMAAIRYTSMQMPPDEMLSDQIIEDFRTWIINGAHDSRDDSAAAPVSRPELEKPHSGDGSPDQIVFGPAWILGNVSGRVWPGGMAAFLCNYP